MTEPVQKIYNSIQEALMDYARLGVDAARRPKPSLKEQACKLLECYGTSGVNLTADQCNTILRALEDSNG